MVLGQANALTDCCQINVLSQLCPLTKRTLQAAPQIHIMTLKYNNTLSRCSPFLSPAGLLISLYQSFGNISLSLTQSSGQLHYCKFILTKFQEPTETITNQNSLFRSRDWLSANQGPVFPDSVSSWTDPDLVTSSGERVLVTKSGWAFGVKYRFGRSNYYRNRPTRVNTNQISLFRSRDCLSANQGPVFPDSVAAKGVSLTVGGGVGVFNLDYLRGRGNSSFGCLARRPHLSALSRSIKWGMAPPYCHSANFILLAHPLGAPQSEPGKPIRTRNLGHFTVFQPIRDQYLLIRSVPDTL
eukprot:sb/3467431/